MLKRVLGALVASLFLSSASLAKEDSYLMATGTTGGTYYPVGVALGTLIKTKLQDSEGISVSAINSAGSAENIRLMREGETQFAIVQGIFGHYAKTGTGPLASKGPQQNIRAIALLWQNAEQWALETKYVTTGTISDLDNVEGKMVGLGKKNSGAIYSNAHILKSLGYEADAFRQFYGGYGPSASAMQDGKIVLVSAPAGIPTGALTKLFASQKKKVTLLGFSPEQAAAADGGLGLWTPFTIPAGTYSGQAGDIVSIAHPNFLAVNADVDEETVYLITKTIFENIPFLNLIHPATKGISLESAVTGLPVDLHPGAIRYYREVGVLPAQE